MSLLEQLDQVETPVESKTKIIPTDNKDPFKPRFVISKPHGERRRPYDSRLFVHAVDRVGNFIYFGVDPKVNDPEAERLPDSDVIQILDSPISEEFYIAACNLNLTITEPGINNRRRVFASPKGEIEMAPSSKDSYPVMEVRFVSYS